ncbi:MAG: RDD family protein [Acidobacteriales bacterium]|nr:RDD family protein [Terriglobales bacterium]
MNPRFEPEAEASLTNAGMEIPAQIVAAGQFDASTVDFAVTAPETFDCARFVVDDELKSAVGNDYLAPEGSRADSTSCMSASPERPASASKNAAALFEDSDISPDCSPPPADHLPADNETPDPAPSPSWRHEVSARINHYHSRRRRHAPRYPSLLLNFDPPERANAPIPTNLPAHSVAATAPQQFLADPDEALLRPTRAVDTNSRKKVLEFPDFFTPQTRFDELAEPVSSGPHIVEACEFQLPPPALGGVTISAKAAPENKPRPGFEIPLHSAPLSRRVLAASIDALLVLLASGLFTYIFSLISKTIPGIKEALPAAVILVATLWATYNYLLLVYSGTTVGLTLVRLHSSRFDGTLLPQKSRRWRVLASLFSAMSLGLGYLWCFLDEDQLCWHDRITRTHIAPDSIAGTSSQTGECAIAPAMPGSAES